jgi:peroxiredoxin
VKIKVLLFIVLWLFNLNFANAQVVNIKGVAEGRSFEKVRVLTYTDQFSRFKQTVASSITDENGYFSLSFNHSFTDYAFLSIELLEGEFYLKPDANYDFIVYPDTVDKGSVFDKLPLQFSLTADDKGLNSNISEFNVLYNRFLIEEFKKIYYSRDKDVVEAFKLKVKSTFNNVTDDYFDNYVTYSYAQLYWISKTKSNNIIAKEYFIDKPVRYNNIQYTDFFKSFFNDYVTQKFYQKYFNELREAVFRGSLNQVDNILKSDELLKSSDTVRELVLMNALAGFYRDKNFSKKGVLSVFNDVKENSFIEFHRKIAGNYIKKLTFLSYGTKAPEFELPTSQGKSLSLSSFKGNFVVLDFLKADCNICLQQIDFLKSLKNKLGGKVVILMMVYGEDAEKISLLLRKDKISWPVLYVGKRIDILDNYGVKVFPNYVIINPDGTIGMAPASLADESLSADLNRIMSVWENRKKN